MASENKLQICFDMFGERYTVRQAGAAKIMEDIAIHLPRFVSLFPLLFVFDRKAYI